MGKNKKTIINVICSILVLVTNLAISFVLSPYIVAHIGVEANGFVTLANNFVTYAQLIVIALNSMAARFISISYIRKDYEKANMYYNSVFWGNLIIVAVLILPATYFIFFMERIINIPADIVFDVKLLFSFVFFNFFIATGLPNWDCGTFISNRLDKKYIPDMATSVLRCVILFSMMSFLSPHVWYVGMTSSVVTIIGLAVAAYNTHTLTSELNVRLKKGTRICSGKAIKELVGSGIWNSITNLGVMLLNGLDLILCDLFIDAKAMGVLALAKTLPHFLTNFSTQIRNAFLPELTINYALDDKNRLLKDIKRSCKFVAVMLSVPLAGIFVMSEDFYRLWVPSQDAHLLAILTSITIFGMVFTSGTQMLYNVFGIVNKVRINAIMILLSGVVTMLIVFLCLKYTNLGIFIVAGASVGVNLIRNLLFGIPYAAYCLGYKKTEFYPQVLMSVITVSIISVIGYFIHGLFSINSWYGFALCTALIGIVGYAIAFAVILNKEEKIIIIEKITKKIRRN